MPTNPRIGYVKYEDDEIAEVRIMAVAEGWAMVRRKSCMPFAKMMDEIAFAEKLDDGLGNRWSPWCGRCGKAAMQIVRPGKVQCGNCD